MFNPSRDQVRDFFFDCWQKGIQGQIMTPLESLGWEIIGHHPEYHALLKNPEASRERAWFPEQGEMNPFLHLSLHLALEEQLSIDQPAGLQAEYQLQCEKLRDEHQARHVLLECLAETLWQSQSDGLPPDSDAYLERVRNRR